ncbi:MAG TPA: GAF domain-containing protein [Phototrophicaceae bacterium]|nr:GAF domain-containing protein [Phototrophicaceae bacterium]
MTKQWPLNRLITAVLGIAALALLLISLFDPNTLNSSRVLIPLLALTLLIAALALLYHQEITRSRGEDQLNQQTERVNQLATLNRILALLTDTLAQDTVIDTVISSASTLAEANAVAIFLFWDEAKSTLALARSAGLSDRFQADLPDPLLVAESKARAVPIDPQPIVVADRTHEPRAASLRSIMEREGKAAWIELPLIFQNMPIGVLSIYYDRPHEFSPETVELLRTFANQCAQAISNARLYSITDEALERRVGQLLALANIGHHLTATLEVQAICDLVASYSQQTTRAQAAAILLLNNEGKIEEFAQVGYGVGALSKNQRLVSGGVTGEAVRKKTTVVSNDVRKDPNYVAFLPNTRAQISTPILWNERIVGVITLESDQLNAFNEEDSYFVQQLANQAIIAIENARLFRKVSEARDRMQVILNTVKEGLILISVTGEIVLVNPRVEIMGLKPEQLIDQPFDDLLEASEIELADRLGFRTSGEVLRLVKELRAPGGLVPREPKTYTVGEDEDLHYVQRQVFPVYDEGKLPVGVLLVFYDVTEEMKLAKTREEVSQMLIHDLRSPLSAVTTSLKLLIDLTPKDSSFYPIVETTTDAGRRAISKLLNRVDSLLDVAKMENGFMSLDARPTELATLVDNVCIELSPLAQELNVTIKPEISPTLPLLEIDSDKVERLLLNLVDNALKFSSADSEVLVRAHEPGAEGAAPGFVRIDVVDSGPGVPDEYKLMLFDRFVQVTGRKGSRRGTGLGLTFCRLVAETHGGRIWIDDNPTGGSIFAFTVPVATENELTVGLD